MSVKRFITKCGEWIGNHKATIISVAGPIVLGLIAKEWGIDYRPYNTSSYQPIRRDSFLTMMGFDQNDPINMACMALMREGARSSWDSSKESAARKILRLLSDADSVTRDQKSAAMSALNGILDTTNWDSTRSFITDIMSKIAAMEEE